ncbi:hypothetical protein EAE96_002572 [Botrytis aclada]|nr:hypothetical protein EAE96_002572 [Botrytis aclada]
MCVTVIVRGPCWCNGNNGKIVNLDEYPEECKNVQSGGSHDAYELLYKEMKVKISKCDKCPHLEAEADRLETEGREAQRIEGERWAEEREAQGGYEGGYQADNRGRYERGYQEAHRGRNL